MKQIIIWFLNVLLLPTFSFAQKSVCGTDEAIQHLNTQKQIERRSIDREPGSKIDLINATGVQGTITIPVVVHVIYNDPSENISDIQIQSQIDVLNEDFRKLNDDTFKTRSIFKPVAGDARIQFCLAKSDPNGDTTSGITRTFSTHTSWDCTDSMKFSIYGGKDPWPNDQYLNIWVVNLSCANGYAYYPGTAAPYDGVVIHYYVFGRTGNIFPGLRGRTTTHEVGHYLGLYHTFEYGECNGTDTSGCAGGGDNICDTPSSDAPGYDCDHTLNTCIDFPVDLPNQIENYMDYADDTCRNMFTNDQIKRMRASLSTYRIGLVLSDGCNPPQPSFNDAALIEIDSPLENVCDLNLSPYFIVGNAGNTLINTFKMNYKLDLGIWNHDIYTNLSIGPGQTLELPIFPMSITPGQHTLSCYVSLPNGVQDQNSMNDTVIINFLNYQSGDGLPIPFSEDFQSLSFPPANWYLYNPGYNRTWEKFSITGNQTSAFACYRSFYNSGIDTHDGLVSPVIDFSTVSQAGITFDVSYSVPTTSSGADTLKLYYSTNCGLTWILLWAKGGSDLSTAPAPATFSEFVPDSSQWRNEFVSLNSIVGQPLVRFMFEEKSHWTNNLYLDNINISPNVSVNENSENSFTVYPNPSNGKIYISSRENSPELFVEIFSTTGKRIYENNFYNASRVEVKLEDFANGMYFINLHSNNLYYSKKIILTKK